MKNKWSLFVRSLICAWILVIGICGCQRRTEPYTKKVNEIISLQRKAENETKTAVQVKMLARMEEQSKKYSKTKDRFPQVEKAYKKSIMVLKNKINQRDKDTLTKATYIRDMEKETPSSIRKRIARLEKLLKTVNTNRKQVYSLSTRKRLDTKITFQIRELGKKVKQVVLSTDDAKKYRDAYAHFTGRGNPLGGGRGNSPIYEGMFGAIGLTKKQFNETEWGIVDYYWNAINNKWITEEESIKAKKAASEKLLAGYYALSPIKVTTMNFYQIVRGDYSSLIGNWHEVATGTNHGGGQGFKWDSLSLNGKIDITKYHISSSEMTLRMSNGKPIFVDNASKENGSSNFDGGLYDPNHLNPMGVTGTVGAFEFSVTFYPAGCKLEDTPPNVNISREHIVLRTSNNSYTEVFERM